MRARPSPSWPSPNWNERRGTGRPDCLILHYTGMQSAAAALHRLCDPKAEVSAHHLIDEDGTVIALVPEDKRAWHAGRSWWQGRGDLNDVAIGIELVNPGHEWGYRPFPAAQMVALVELASSALACWGIPSWQVLAHSDVAPDRKLDPGELFDWPGLAAAGIGVWPEEGLPATPDEAAARTALAAIGYPLEPQGSPLATTLAAFQRRYRSALIDGRLDAATMGRVLAVDGLLQRLRGASSGG